MYIEALQAYTVLGLFEAFGGLACLVLFIAKFLVGVLE